MATSVTKSKKAQPSAEDKSAFGPIAERFRRAGDLERAVSLCREGLGKFPDNISARVTLGWALLELGKFDESRVELEQVLRRRPDNLAAIRALAELHDRAEHTMNLPMDGPGQWPPSPDKVDEMAGGMVADHFRSVSEDESPDAGAEEPQGILSQHPQPSVVPPAELGLAMWSALPPTEAPAEAEPSHLSIAPTTVPDEPAASVADHSVAPDIDIAALLAEVESLEALENQPAAVPQEVTEVAQVAYAEPPAAMLSQVALEADADLAAEPVLATAEPFEVAPVELASFHDAAATPIEVAATPVELASFHDVASAPVEVTAASPVEPGFELEGLSIAAMEAAADVPVLDEPAPEVLAADDTQPILRFDLEPVAEIVPEPVAVTVAELPTAASSEPESVEPIALVVPEAVVESAVISSAQARIAEVVAMARHAEPATAKPKATLVALESFLSRVQARRRTMAESVA